MTPYYTKGEVSVYHGDCREVLPLLPRRSADLLLTDAPYGMAYVSNVTNGATANVSADGVRQGVRIVRQALFEASPVLNDEAHALIFCHWQSWPDFYDAACAHFQMRNALIWHKPWGSLGQTRRDYMKDYEVILYGGRGSREVEMEEGGRYSAVLTGIQKVGNVDRLHVTQKPEALLALLVSRHCPPGGRVLDPFAGSGTTGVVAYQLGRGCDLVEIEEKYCEIAARRLEAEPEPLFPPEPAPIPEQAALFA